MCLKKVLVLDDSKADQLLAKITLSKFDPDIEIFTAWSAREALTLLEQENERIDFVFVDINMPELNGFEFLDAYLKKKETSDNIAEPRFVMLSSSDLKEDVERAKTFDCIGEYLVKPLNQEKLTATHQKLCEDQLS